MANDTRSDDDRPHEDRADEHFDDTPETDRIPDLALILGSSADTARDRLAQRGAAQDRFEAEDADFFARVAAGYRERAQAPHAVWIDAEGDEQTVFARIRPHLEALRQP